MYNLILIFLINFFARIISTSMGGGGMVVIPALIHLGLSPVEAIASNRMGAQGISASMYKFHKEGLINWKLGAYLIPPSIIGSILGSLVVVNIDENFFKKLLATVFLLSLPVLIYKKKLGIEKRKISPIRKKIAWVMALFAAVLGGMFASTGLWFNYVFLFLGLTMLETAGTRKVIGSVIGLSSLVVLIYNGFVVWSAALAIFLSSILGSLVGASIAIKAGNVWIKRVFIVVVLANIFKMFFE